MEQMKRVRSDLTEFRESEIPRRAGPVPGVSITTSEAKFLLAT